VNNSYRIPSTVVEDDTGRDEKFRTLSIESLRPEKDLIIFEENI